MNILILTSCYPRFKDDHSGIFIQEYVNHLRQSGILANVLAPDNIQVDRRDTSNSSVYRFNYFWPRKSQRLAYGSGMPDNLKGSFLAKLQVIPFLTCFLLRSFRLLHEISIIHAHWIIPSGLIGALLSCITRKDLVVSVHSSDLWMINRNILMRKVGVFIFQKAKIITIVSGAQRQVIKDILRHRYDVNKVIKIPMGVDDLFETKTEELKNYDEMGDHNFKVLFLGRLVKVKGVEYLIKAMRGMDKMELLVYGDGKEEKRLKFLASKLGVNVLFSGGKTKFEKHKLIEHSDVVVVPSIVEKDGRTEGLPIVLLEALAHGKPVIASRVGGIQEIIKDKINGILVEPGDVLALRNALKMLYQDAGLRLNLRNEARKTAEDFYWPKIKDKFVNVYQTLKA